MQRLIAFIAAAALLAGCSEPMSKTQKGAIIGSLAGAAAGAVVGQATGKDTRATLTGAAIGAAAGGLTGAGIGRYMDKQEEAMRQELARAEGVSVQREMNNLAVTFRSDMLFDVNSAALKPAFRDELGRVAGVVNDYPQTTLVVAGHTDSSGAADYNLKLSELRAGSVRQALVDAGVAPGRIETIGYGETMPVADNGSESGRAMNRRVNITIKPVEGAQ